MTEAAPHALLGPVAIRSLADRLGLHPRKSLGQNFVVDSNTIRRIVRAATVGPADTVLEVGPGLGSLTLALLPAVSEVIAVEVDPLLAGALAVTVGELAPDLVARLQVVTADVLTLEELPGSPPTALVANLPYNVSVPVLLHVLATFPTVTRALIMVQLEVAQRLAAPPGSRTYGVPSAKAAWYGKVRQAGLVSRGVFWPVPNVDSGLVSLVRKPPPRTDVPREEVFKVIDAAFSQRRKMLRSALASWAGSPGMAEAILRRAGIDPAERGESVDVAGFADIAAARLSCPAAQTHPGVDAVNAGS